MKFQLQPQDIEYLREASEFKNGDFRFRLLVTATLTFSFALAVGWAAAGSWFAACAAVHMLLGPWLKRGAHDRSQTSQAWRTLAFLFLAEIAGGSIAIVAALKGGVWGFVVGEFFLASVAAFAGKSAGRSKWAYAATLLPTAAFMVGLLAIAVRLQAPPGMLLALSCATAVYLVNVGVMHQSSRELMRALDDARRHAEAATAAKSAFVAMVSHELRTPISGILAGAAELAKSAPSVADRSNAALIGESGKMMRALLNDLLDLSKIEAGKMTIEAIPFDLRALVLSTVRFWSPEVRKNQLRLRLRGSRGLPEWVTGDPTRIRQILNNFLSNGLKFTKVGSLTVQLRIGTQNPDRMQLFVDVIDTGPGMDEQQLGRLFQAFDQLGASTSRTHGGTGLGLKISRELAQLMDGDVTVRSTPGVGSTFTLEIPVLPCVAESENSDELVGDVRLGLRVLVVDDHHVNRQAFSLILASVCEEVVCAENGRIALEILETAPFDIVLMDLNMPEVGGLEATRRLRAGHGLNSRTAVIALTASVSPAEQDACLAAGMDAFVMKPVDAGELLTAMRVTIERIDREADGVEVPQTTTASQSVA